MDRGRRISQIMTSEVAATVIFRLRTLSYNSEMTSDNDNGYLPILNEIRIHINGIRIYRAL